MWLAKFVCKWSPIEICAKHKWIIYTYIGLHTTHTHTGSVLLVIFLYAWLEFMCTICIGQIVWLWYENRTITGDECLAIYACFLRSIKWYWKHSGLWMATVVSFTLSMCIHRFVSVYTKLRKSFNTELTSANDMFLFRFSFLFFR